MEMPPNPEEGEKEPTSKELAEALKEVLTEEDCLELEQMEFDEALGYAFTLMIEAGIDDPEGYLVEKGILQANE